MKRSPPILSRSSPRWNIAHTAAKTKSVSAADGTPFPKKIVAEIAAVSQRLAKAKKRASALSGEEFPDYEEDAEAK